MLESEFTPLDDLLDELEGGINTSPPDKDIIAALLIDCSGSMATPTADASGKKRPRNEGAAAGVRALIDYCLSVPFLRGALQLGIGRFGAEVGFDAFERVDAVQPPDMQPGGLTPLGAGLNLALDAIQEIVCRLDDQERRFSIPNLCIVSDGAPDGGAELDSAVARAAKLVKSGDLSISLVGIDRVDCERLRTLGLPGDTYCIADVAWEQVIQQATLGGGATASQHDAA